MRARMLIALTLVSTAFTMASFASPLTRQIDRLPTVPAPPQAHVEWIAEHMRMNGLPMTLRAFRAPSSPEDTLRFYESWWATHATDREAQSIRTHTPDWEVLALTSATHHISVQVRPAHTGTEGTIAVSLNPQRAKVAIHSDFPLTDSLRIENLQQYEDDGVHAEHITARSHRTVAIETTAVRERLTRSGWTIIRSQSSQVQPRGHVLQAQKGTQLAHVAVHPINRATAVIIIWRKR